MLARESRTRLAAPEDSEVDWIDRAEDDEGFWRWWRRARMGRDFISVVFHHLLPRHDGSELHS